MRVPSPPPAFEYKATPIPPEVSAPIFDRLMNEKEEERKARINIRAQRLMRESALPPRMQMHQQQDSTKVLMIL